MGMLKEGKSAGVEPDECYNIIGKGDQQAGITRKSTEKKKCFVMIVVQKPHINGH